jgi:hypothetical protein
LSHRLWDKRGRRSFHPIEVRPTSFRAPSSICLGGTFVVIELKTVPFQPEFAGKMNFYLSAVDAEMRHPDDKPSIGLLLCKSKNQLVVEYALRDVQKPIGVAEWETKIVTSLPASLKGSLPTVEELEAELSSPEEET